MATLTIRDVAKASGFSSSTVSIVLNDAPLARYIPPVTKTRIQQAAKKLGYRPNLFARSLRGKRNREVAAAVRIGRSGARERIDGARREPLQIPRVERGVGRDDDHA